MPTPPILLVSRAIAAAALGACGCAWGEGIQVCNKHFDGPLDFAFVHVDDKELFAPWKGAGWWSLAPGECHRIKTGDVTNSRTFFRFHSNGRIFFKKNNSGNMRVRYEAVDAKFCAIHTESFSWSAWNKNFTLSTDRAICEGKLSQFYFPYVVRVNDERVYVTISPSPNWESISVDR